MPEARILAQSKSRTWHVNQWLISFSALFYAFFDPRLILSGYLLRQRLIYSCDTNKQTPNQQYQREQAQAEWK
jgi:hypothetical protein